MGQFLTILSRQKKNRSQLQFFYNHSLTKIAEFYEQYKSISDTLAIDDSQFSQIFGSQNLMVFQILDTDKNLLIDGLELFAGLVLYSKIIKFEDKISFLFNLFDFNQQNSLFPNDIEFMFLSCCTFTHKIYSLRSQLNEVWIEQFVRSEFFNGEIKINISQILKWAKQSPFITIFFQQILQRPINDTSSVLAKKIYIKKFTQEQQNDQLMINLNQKVYEKFISRAKEKFQTYHEQKIEYSNCDVCFDVDWAYGIRVNDLKRVMKIIYDKWGNLQIIYLIGKIVVIYKLKSKTQRHYRQHRYPVISMDTNQTKKLIASGQQTNNSQIRIWSYESLKTLTILKTNHKNGVHIINFTKDGNYLVHAGCNSQGSLNIHNLISNQLIYSLYCSSPIVDINQVSNFTNVFFIESLMTGLYDVSHLSITVEGYNEGIQNPNQRRVQTRIKENIFEACQFSTDGKPISKITCSEFYFINRNFNYLDQYDQAYNKYILTGHQQGEVNVWNPQYKTLEFQLCQQKSEIIKIVLTRDYVIVVSDSSYLSFWDIAIQKRQRKKIIDITQISYHLHSYNVRDLIPLRDQQQFLICTAKGDLFILGKQIKGNQIMKFSLIQRDYEVQLIDQIFPIEGNIACCKLLVKGQQGKNYQQLYYGGDQGIIFTINVKTHLKLSAWNIGEKIVHFDVSQSKHHGTMIVAATESNKVYVKIGHVQSTEKIEVRQNIVFVLLSQDTSTLILSTSYYEQNTLRVYSITPKLTFSFNISIPLAEKVVFMQFLQRKSLLCVTQSNAMLLISLKDFHIKSTDQFQRSFSNPVISLVYWLKQKNSKYMPIVIGAQAKALLMAKIDGTIMAWKNQEQLQLGSKVQLYGHSSYCSSLLVNQQQTRFYSSGYSDGLLLEWSLKFFIQKNSATTDHLLKIQLVDQDEDQFLQRQVSFSIFKNNLLTDLYDQHLLVRGIGSKNDTLSKLFKSMLNQWKLINQSYPNIKDQPGLGLKLDFVMGIQVFNKTQTVLSLKNKKIAYFVSRVVIIYDPSLNKQSIYTGHRFKITCIHKLEKEDKQLIASGESCFRPKIHIWSTSTLQTLKIIETSHRWGIINLTIQGQYMLSYGFKQSSSSFEQIPPSSNNKSLNYQFQLIHIWTEQKLSSLIFKNPIYCMRIHPQDCSQIVVSTYGCVIFYQSQNGYFTKKSICYVDDEHVTCMLFYQIKGKNKKRKQLDLLVGTKKGTIAMICQQKNLAIIKAKAHEQRINCLLKISVGQKNDMFFVTTSQDQMIKIWSKNFALAYFNQMKRNQSDQVLKGNFDRKGGDINYVRNRAVQSLTIFSQTPEKNPTLLLGTRNGDIFEMIIQTDFNQKDPFRNSKYLLYSKNNITQSHFMQTKKVLIAHHPKQQIIVTIGEDQNLLFWDTDASGGGNRFIFSKYLGYTSIPTAMKFSKQGQYLIIGFNDGLLIFLDSKIGKSLPGKTDDKFIMPSLSLLKKQKAQQNNAILNIELSDTGQHLAVSYNYRIITTKQKKNISSNSFISLFNKKIRDKIKGYNKMDNDRIFEKFTSIICPYAESTFKTVKNNQYGMAAYSMTFAQGQGKYYLLIYYQLIDSFQNRQNYSTDGKYSVWDVSTSTMIANLDLVGSLNWKKLCFQNSIISKYKFWKNLIQQKKTNIYQDEPINNNLYIPHMSALINIPNHLILGSVNGDLHIIKSSSIQFDGSNPQEKDMFIGKTYPAHCSQVNQIEINPDKVYIYTTSILDQCIFKYRIEGSTKLNVQEPSFYQNTQSVDIFNQVPSLEHHKLMLSIYEQKQKLQSRKWIDSQNFLHKIQIIEMIGRKSSTVRQNIYLDNGNNIIYHVGQSIINWNHENKTKSFICLLNQSHHQLNQITQLKISHDNRSLIASHSGLNKVTIVQWESSCKNILKEFYINNLTMVLLMKLNHNNSRLVVYGIDNKTKPILILIDFTNSQPLAVVSYAHKPVWVIKAIQFAEDSQSIFYTCGVQETRKWTFSGNQLTYQEILLDTSKEQKIIHLAMLVLNKVLITGGDDGSIFAWKNELLRKQQHDSMVNCLAKDSYSNKNTFVSGGKDGNVVIWSLEANALVMSKKISILSLISPFDKHTSINLKQISFNHEIQSINIFKSQMIIGTRNGSIYQTNMTLLNSSLEESPIQEKFSFHDFEVIKALFFTSEQNLLYQISKDGFFTIWMFRQYRSIYSQAFREETIDMKYHTKTNTIFFAFKKQLRVFIIEKDEVSASNMINTNSKNMGFKLQTSQSLQKNCTYNLHELPQLSISLKHITHLSFSKNEKMLALGIQSNSDKSISIQIYEIPDDIRSSRVQLKKLFKITLASQILFIDFSINNKFLLVCLTDNIMIRDLSESKNVNQQLISKIQWCHKGLVYGKQAEPSISEWMKTWGGVNKPIINSKQGGKMKQRQSDIRMTGNDRLKKIPSNLGDKKQKLSLTKRGVKPSQFQQLTVCRLEGDRYLLVQKYGSIYVYHGQNMISKLTLPITRIDHLSVSSNKKLVALGSQIDRMIIIVDISKCSASISNNRENKQQK